MAAVPSQICALPLCMALEVKSSKEETRPSHLGQLIIGEIFQLSYKQINEWLTISQIPARSSPNLPSSVSTFVASVTFS